MTSDVGTELVSAEVTARLATLTYYILRSNVIYLQIMAKTLHPKGETASNASGPWPGLLDLQLSHQQTTVRQAEGHHV